MVLQRLTCTCTINSIAWRCRHVCATVHRSLNYASKLSFDRTLDQGGVDCASCWREIRLADLDSRVDRCRCLQQAGADTVSLCCGKGECTALPSIVGNALSSCKAHDASIQELQMACNMMGL